MHAFPQTHVASTSACCDYLCSAADKSSLLDRCLSASLNLSFQALTALTHMAVNPNNDPCQVSPFLCICFNCIHFQTQWGLKICVLLMSGSADSGTLGTFSVCVLGFQGSLLKALGQTLSGIQSISVDEITPRFHCRFLLDFSGVPFSQCPACWNLQLCDNPQKTCSVSTSATHNQRRTDEFREALTKLLHYNQAFHIIYSGSST